MINLRTGIVIVLASVVLRLIIHDDVSYFVSCFLFGLGYGTLHQLLGIK